MLKQNFSSIVCRAWAGLCCGTLWLWLYRNVLCKSYSNL